MGKIANSQSVANAVTSRKPFRNSTWNECSTNERQSRDSDRSTTKAGSVRTNFRVLGGRYDRQRTLAIRIAAITLASDSAITIARFRSSKAPKFGEYNGSYYNHSRFNLLVCLRPTKAHKKNTYACFVRVSVAHQDRTNAVAGDVDVERAKSSEFPQT